jgi:hypothetical protein
MLAIVEASLDDPERFDKPPRKSQAADRKVFKLLGQFALR